MIRASLMAQLVKKSTRNARDLGSVPRLGRCPGEGNSYLLQASILAWRIPRTSPWGHKKSDTTERLSLSYDNMGASLGAQTVKNLPVMQETRVLSLDWEDPLEKEMAVHSSILAWKKPMDRETSGATVHRVTVNRTQLSDCFITSYSYYIIIIIILSDKISSRKARICTFCSLMYLQPCLAHSGCFSINIC